VGEATEAEAIVPVLVMFGASLLVLVVVPISMLVVAGMYLLRSGVAWAVPAVRRRLPLVTHRVRQRLLSAGHARAATIVAVVLASAIVSLAAPVHAVDTEAHPHPTLTGDPLVGDTLIGDTLIGDTGCCAARTAVSAESPPPPDGNPTRP
jgi:hypothetical protein